MVKLIGFWALCEPTKFIRTCGSTRPTNGGIMKKFMLVLLAAFIAVGVVMAQPKTSVAFTVEALAVENLSTDTTEFQGWVASYLRSVANQEGFSPYVAAEMGMGAKDGAIIGYWGNMSLGFQGGNGLFWAVGANCNFADVAFGLEGALGGVIDMGDTKLRLEGSTQAYLPFVKRSFATKGDKDYLAIDFNPKVGVIFKSGVEVGLTGGIFMENRLVNGETNTDLRVGAYLALANFDIGFGVQGNRWNLNKDGDPMLIPSLKVGFKVR